MAAHLPQQFHPYGFICTAIHPAPTPSLSKCPGRVLRGSFLALALALARPCFLSVKKNRLHADQVRATQQQGSSLLPLCHCRVRATACPRLWSCTRPSTQAFGPCWPGWPRRQWMTSPGPGGGIPIEDLLPKADTRAQETCKSSKPAAATIEDVAISDG